MDLVESGACLVVEVQPGELRGGEDGPAVRCLSVEAKAEIDLRRVRELALVDEIEPELDCVAVHDADNLRAAGERDFGFSHVSNFFEPRGLARIHAARIGASSAALAV